MKPRFDHRIAQVCAAALIAVSGALFAHAAAAQEMSASEIIRRLQMQRKAVPVEGTVDPVRTVDSVRKTAGLITAPTPLDRAETIDLVILFALGSDELAPQAERQLGQLCIAMRNDLETGARYQVIGHTDATGDDRENLILSQSRAERVVKWLAGPDCRLDTRRMTPVGKGESRLRLPDRPDDAANRRVEIQIRS
ncbi:MAG: outer membrane protein OmpA-like peptidoglycan-associated protein [Paracoccaceae bacterium]